MTEADIFGQMLTLQGAYVKICMRPRWLCYMPDFAWDKLVLMSLWMIIKFAVVDKQLIVKGAIFSSLSEGWTKRSVCGSGMLMPSWPRAINKSAELWGGIGKVPLTFSVLPMINETPGRGGGAGFDIEADPHCAEDFQPRLLEETLFRKLARG